MLKLKRKYFILSIKKFEDFIVKVLNKEVKDIFFEIAKNTN